MTILMTYKRNHPPSTDHLAIMDSDEELAQALNDFEGEQIGGAAAPHGRFEFQRQPVVERRNATLGND